jgi:signal transduction histidine kinase
MGLTAIIEQVEMLGGKIAFDSSIGRGTRVELSLPI